MSSERGVYENDVERECLVSAKGDVFGRRKVGREKRAGKHKGWVTAEGILRLIKKNGPPKAVERKGGPGRKEYP